MWNIIIVTGGTGFIKSKIRYLPKREGERLAPTLTKINLKNKIIRLSAKIRHKNYVNNFLINNR
jgi:hypothetical protein